jgi:hypothetical protein
MQHIVDILLHDDNAAAETASWLQTNDAHKCSQPAWLPAEQAKNGSRWSGTSEGCRLQYAGLFLRYVQEAVAQIAAAAEEDVIAAVSATKSTQAVSEEEYPALGGASAKVLCGKLAPFRSANCAGYAELCTCVQFCASCALSCGACLLTLRSHLSCRQMPKPETIVTTQAAATLPTYVAASIFQGAKARSFTF